MPIIPGPVSIPNQVLPDGSNPYVNQGVTSYWLGQIQFWNPDLSQPKLLALLNNALRVVYDRRTWFGLYITGQLVAPQAVTTGQVTTTLGSTTVIGTGTSWDDSLVGRQFRIGYNNPIYTIASVTNATTLDLQLEWGSPSVTSGYFIIQNYFNLGPNIKYLKTMLNVQLGYKFDLHATQDTLNTLDPWRQNTNFPYIAAGMPAAQDGSYLQELYPASWTQQAFPFNAYIQPPNVVNDSDPLPTYIRGDVVIKHAIADALVIGGPKNNAYYDAAESTRKRQEFEGELMRMAYADENLYRTEVVKFGEDLPYYSPGGALFSATHAYPADAGGGGYRL